MTEKEFISLNVQKIYSGLREFPGEFIQTDNYRVFSVNARTLVLGNELFGSFEVTTIDGTPVYQADDYDTAKFIIYASRGKPDKINIPLDHELIKKGIVLYEQYVRNLITETNSRYRQEFPSSKDPDIVSEIFRRLNLVVY